MKHVTSRDNPFFKQLKKLAESGRARRQAGQTLLDGMHLLEAYEKRFGPVETLVIGETALTAGGDVAARLAGREMVVLKDALLRDLGLVDTPTGVLAIVPVPAACAVVDFEKSTILLDGVQDPGNVGTLLRTAAAAGYRQIVMSPGCAAAWSPRVLRAGQGAHFALDIHEEVDLLQFAGDFSGCLAVTCLTGSISLFDAQWQDPVAWVFGAEGRGVRPELIDRATLKVRIPMPGDVESLNVSAAAAICLFEGVRRMPRG